MDDGQLIISPEPTKDRSRGARKHLPDNLHHLDWYWLFVPLLAVVAYASVLRIGFLGDDLVLLGQAHASGINASGQIVGDYSDSAGVAHGFLATPVP